MAAGRGRGFGRYLLSGNRHGVGASIVYGHTMQMTLFNAALLGIALAQPANSVSERPQGSPQTAGTRPPGAARSADLGALSNEQLIKLLPPARSELICDPAMVGDVEHPASQEFGRRLLADTVTSEQLGAALMQTTPLRSSPLWFDGKEYAVWFRTPGWLCGYELTAQARLDGASPAHALELCDNACGVGMGLQRDRESYQPIARLPRDAREIVFDVTARPILHRRSPEWRGTVVVPVQVVASRDIEADASPRLTEAVRKAASVWVDATGGADAFALMGILFDRPPNGVTDGVSILLRIELLRDGIVVAHRVELEHDESYEGEAVADTGMEWIMGEVARDLADPAKDGQFAIRVSGQKPPGASRWCRTRYWSGEFTVPLAGHARRAVPKANP
jgi:hypothetical protein